MITIKRSNKKLESRLYNFKFRDAQGYIEGEDKRVCDIVNALAETFDNCGWIDGKMDDILWSSIRGICPWIDENNVDMESSIIKKLDLAHQSRISIKGQSFV